MFTVYDGEHAWADFDDAEDVLARFYLFGERIDEIIARWQPSEGTAWYLTDHLGTVRDIVDDTGALVNTITYDSFGNVLGQTNASAGIDSPTPAASTTKNWSYVITGPVSTIRNSGASCARIRSRLRRGMRGSSSGGGKRLC